MNGGYDDEMDILHLLGWCCMFLHWGELMLPM
jgi:hypothetical protein